MEGGGVGGFFEMGTFQIFCVSLTRFVDYHVTVVFRIWQTSVLV